MMHIAPVPLMCEGGLLMCEGGLLMCERGLLMCEGGLLMCEGGLLIGRRGGAQLGHLTTPTQSEHPICFIGAACDPVLPYLNARRGP